jgi:uncharacterized protein
MKKVVKTILIIIGSISVGLGVLGIILPVLPTTPFLLLGAACYIKGSPRFYNWLINNKWLGNYIRSYYEGKGITIKSKIIAVSSLWITIGYSIVFIISILLLRILLFFIAAGVTFHILSLKTLEKYNEKQSEEETEVEEGIEIEN